MNSPYEYESLRAAALAPGASQDDINRLGLWLQTFGDWSKDWNGSCWDIDDGKSLFPVYRKIDVDDYDLVGFSLENPEDLVKEVL